MVGNTLLEKHPKKPKSWHIFGAKSCIMFTIHFLVFLCRLPKTTVGHLVVPPFCRNLARSIWSSLTFLTSLESLYSRIWWNVFEQWSRRVLSPILCTLITWILRLESGDNRYIIFNFNLLNYSLYTSVNLCDFFW